MASRARKPGESFADYHNNLKARIATRAITSAVVSSPVQRRVKQFPRQPERFGSHMVRWKSRITLEIVNIRVERLQDISEDDAKAEGADREYEEPYQDWAHLERDCGYFSPSSFSTGFERLWNGINAKKHPWASNPFVWVIEFRREEL